MLKKEYDRRIEILLKERNTLPVKPARKETPNLDIGARMGVHDWVGARKYLRKYVRRVRESYS